MNKHFTEWMQEGRDESSPWVTKPLELADGTKLSIQASQLHYYFPKKTLDQYSMYETFEIGFPTKVIPEIMEHIFYHEEDRDPTSCVYCNVPKVLIEQLIENRGGVIAHVENW